MRIKQNNRLDEALDLTRNMAECGLTGHLCTVWDHGLLMSATEYNPATGATFCHYNRRNPALVGTVTYEKNACQTNESLVSLM